MHVYGVNNIVTVKTKPLIYCNIKHRLRRLVVELRNNLKFFELLEVYVEFLEV